MSCALKKKKKSVSLLCATAVDFNLLHFCMRPVLASAAAVKHKTRVCKHGSVSHERRSAEVRDEPQP